ncbi:MAG: ATP F0F1 synthase subunit B [Alphaproteobacteria bacterium]
MPQIELFSLIGDLFWSLNVASGQASDGGGGGMPQLNSADWSTQLFWLVVTFGILYLIMSKIALPRVGDILRTREERIADDLDRAESLNREADGALAAYEQGLADARAKANEIAAETRSRIQAETEAHQTEAEARLAAQAAEAESRIADARADAMSNVSEIATGAAVAIVERLLGKAPDTGQVDNTVRAELDSRGIK